MDGALEDPETVARARELIVSWEGESGEGALRRPEAPDVEAALGLLMLQFATSGGDDAGQLRRLLRLARSHGGGAGCLGGALRKACTAAARQAFGRGRDGDALLTSRRDGVCGSLLLLCHALLPRSAVEARAEAFAVEAGVRRAFFGFEGEEERGVRLRDESARRLLSLEARRVVRDSLRRAAEAARRAAEAAPVASASSSAAVLASDGWRRPLDELPELLKLPAAGFVAPLLYVVEDLLCHDLERALALWVRSGGARRVTYDPAAWRRVEVEVGEEEGEGEVHDDAASSDDAAAAQRAAFAMAAGAAHLARRCLALGSPARVAETADEQIDASRLSLLRSVGLTSATRHRFYQAIVHQALDDEVQVSRAARRGGGAVLDGSQSAMQSANQSAAAAGEVAGLCVEDCIVLRRLMAVLPTSAATGEREAIAAVTSAAEAAGLEVEHLRRRLAG